MNKRRRRASRSARDLRPRARTCMETGKKKNTPPGNGAKAIYAQLPGRRRLIGGIGKRQFSAIPPSSDPIRQGHTGWLCVRCAHKSGSHTNSSNKRTRFKYKAAQLARAEMHSRRDISCATESLVATNTLPAGLYKHKTANRTLFCFSNSVNCAVIYV